MLLHQKFQYGLQLESRNESFLVLDLGMYTKFMHNSILYANNLYCYV